MAQGKFGGGTGIPDNPYLIEDAEDLFAIRYFPNSNFKLAYSINLGTAPYNTGKGWNPIKDFAGTLDGNGKKIYNLFINRPDKSGVGLFENIKVIDNYPQRISNLCIENANIVGKTNVGVLAGGLVIYQTAGGAPAYYIVDRCYFSGKVTAEGNGGGIFGYMTWDAASQAMLFSLGQDIFIDVFLQPSAVSSAFGAVAGTIYNSATKNFILNYVISACSFSNMINGLANASLNPTSFGTFSGVAYFAAGYSNLFYDNTRWLTAATPGTTGISTDNMTKTRFSDMDLRLTSDGSQIWDYEEGTRYPLPRQFFLDRYFVRTNDGYCVYEIGSWVIKYTTMPTRAQAVNNGMKSISHIPYTAWDVLRATNTKVDIINIVELSNGTTQQSVSFPMTLDGANSAADKNYFRKEIKFTDFGNNIVTMNKGVVA